MFVQVLPTTKTTSSVDLLLGCQIFQRGKMLKINGLSLKKDYKDAKSLISCGYSIHPFVVCVGYLYYMYIFM